MSHCRDVTTASIVTCAVTRVVTSQRVSHSTNVTTANAASAEKCVSRRLAFTLTIPPRAFHSNFEMESQDAEARPRK